MCDYSLANVNSRPAKQGDKLKTNDFGGTRGFRAADDHSPVNQITAICLLPGTEVSFGKDVLTRATNTFVGLDNGVCRPIGIAPRGARTATFVKVNEHEEFLHHDALEFADGTVVLLNDLVPNQKATVLSLPATSMTSANNDKEAARQFVAA